MGRRCFVSGFLGLAVIMLFVGCSHNNIRSNDNIARAQAAIDNAQKSQGWTYAPVEMKAAQDKLSEAREAARSDEHEKASRLADQVAVDARLAEKKADAERAKKAAGDIRDTVNVLRQSSGLPPR